MTTVAIFASRFRLVKDHTTVPYIFLWWFFWHFPAFLSRRSLFFETKTFRGISSVSLCPRFWCRRGRLCFLTTVGSVTETTRVSFWTLSSCFPQIAFSHFPLNAAFSLLLTLDQYSCLNPFIPDFEVPRPNHLINVSSDHGLQSFKSQAVLDLDPFLGRT